MAYIPVVAKQKETWKEHDLRDKKAKRRRWLLHMCHSSAGPHYHYGLLDPKIPYEDPNKSRIGYP